jgi:hypothetical protein
MSNIKDKVIDTFQFRIGTEKDDHGNNQPILTFGSIIWGIMFRTALVVFISFPIVTYSMNHELWWFVSGILWFFAVYPGYNQHQVMQERHKNFSAKTLCGSCKNFNEPSRLCVIYDEHPTTEVLPCLGESWEPRSLELIEEEEE